MELEHPYCKFVSKLESTNVHKTYHDEIYGFPISSDNELFGTLILEINQAGLSWDIIMKKSDNFRDAYSNFDINTVAKYEEKDIEVSYKPVTVSFKHVSKISDFTIEENVEQFVENNPPPRKKRRISFKTEDDLKEYLGKFSKFNSKNIQRKLFEQHGFKVTDCTNSIFNSNI